MGGMGFIENNKVLCMLSVLVNTHLLDASRRTDERHFFSPSLRVYAAGKQTDPNVTALAEGDAYPAMPEDGYGWEKLFFERMCRHFTEDGLDLELPGTTTAAGRTRTTARPEKPWPPSAEDCRGVQVKIGEIEGMGDGCDLLLYTDDACRAPKMLMDSDISEPLEHGSAEAISSKTTSPTWSRSAQQVEITRP